MAKKYFEFKALDEILQEGGGIEVKFKPWGTLGLHHMRIRWCMEGVEVRGFNSGKRRDGTREVYPESEWLLVKPGASICYDCGRIYVQKPLNELTPLQRFRRVLKVAKENVILTDDIESVTVSGLESRVKDGNRMANKNRFWGDGEDFLGRTENCAITLYYKFKGGVDQRCEIYMVYLKKSNIDAAIEDAVSMIEGFRGEGFSNVKTGRLIFAP